MSEVTNKIISINYKLFRNNAEGEMIETTEGKEPLVFMSGVSQMIPEFEAQVIDLNVGETFSFGIKSENAYGTRSEDDIIELPQDMFKQDGKMIDQSASVRDYQKFLEQNILKLNHKSFHQIVVLGSSSFIPFMQLTSNNRREVVEDLLDINIFSKMKGILKDRNTITRNSAHDTKIDLHLHLL